MQSHLRKVDMRLYRAVMARNWRGCEITFSAPNDIEACWIAKESADDRDMKLESLEYV